MSCMPESTYFEEHEPNGSNQILDSNISKLPCQNIINDQYLNVWEVRKTFAREKPEKKKKKLFTCHSDLFTNILILMMLS